MPSPELLNNLFLDIGADSTLSKNGLYIYYRCFYLCFKEKYIENYDNFYATAIIAANEMNSASQNLISELQLSYFPCHNYELGGYDIFSNKLFKLISELEPDIFINTYFNNYFTIREPFSFFCNSFLIIRKGSAIQVKLIISFFQFLMMKEKHPK